MTRAAAVARAQNYFDSGAFKADLERRVAIPTESQNPERAPDLARYIESEIQPALEKLGFKCRILTQARAKGPFLYAERMEDAALPTIFGYGHGDVIRGLDAGWHAGLSPWSVTEKDGRYYGRGVVDNKGQHTINIAAQAAVLTERASSVSTPSGWLKWARRPVRPACASSAPSTKTCSRPTRWLA